MTKLSSPTERKPSPMSEEKLVAFNAHETIGVRLVNPVFGGTSLKELEEKQKSSGWDHRLEAKALDRGAKQGMTLEALDTVFAIACQQVPSMEKRWMELKAEINVIFAQKWAAGDMPK